MARMLLGKCDVFPTPRAIRTYVFVSVAIGALAARAEASDPESEPHPQRTHMQWAAGAAPGYALYEGNRHAFWLEVFARKAFAVGPDSAILLSGGAFATFYERERGRLSQFVAPETNSERVFGTGLIARGYFSHQFGPVIGGRVGPLAGIAHVAFDSTACGSGSVTAPFVGLSIGPVARVSTRLELALHADIANIPSIACGSEETADPFVYVPAVRSEKMGDDDDEHALVFALNVAYLF